MYPNTNGRGYPHWRCAVNKRAASQRRYDEMTWPELHRKQLLNRRVKALRRRTCREQKEAQHGEV
jgi:hypothetical protein